MAARTNTNLLMSIQDRSRHILIVVIQYLELCRKFWRMDTGRLDKWIQEIKDGKIPDFGANLVY